MVDSESSSSEPHRGHAAEVGAGRGSVLIASVALVLTLVCWLLSATVGGTALHVTFLLCQVVMISIIIWQACDPFADAAQWIGKTLHIPGSVRGATLDAVASSMPELFTGVFFVVLAIVTSDGSAAETSRQGGEGFAATVATCAGSAVYNMILIPAICAIFVSYYRPSRPTIDIEDKVIARDGVWFLGCEIVLIFFLFQNAMHWWMALSLLGLYSVYVWFLYRDARAFRRVQRGIRKRIEATMSTQELIELLAADGIDASRALIEEVRNEMFYSEDGDITEEDEFAVTVESASFLFGRFEVPLGHGMAWAVIAASTVVAAIACYWLVEVTKETSAELGIPIFFVAVILAAAASSVPDTFLSVGAAKRGDDDGAVSNAFGSNVFDICICLTVPLLLGSWLNGWRPIQMLTEEGKPLPGIYGLRILLCALTLITLLIMWHNRQLTRPKAYVLCVLYLVFIGYAVAGSMGFSLGDLAS